jgi:hypothetical protein
MAISPLSAVTNLNVGTQSISSNARNGRAASFHSDCRRPVYRLAWKRPVSGRNVRGHRTAAASAKPAAFNVAPAIVPVPAVLMRDGGQAAGKRSMA